MKSIPEKWQRLHRKTLLDSKFMTVYQDTVKLPSGAIFDDYTVATLPSGVIVVATDTKGRLLVQSEYKYAIDKIILNLPSGSIEDGDILETARRELIEETGYAAEEFTLVRKLYEYPSKLDHTIYIVRAKNIHKLYDVAHEDTESISNIRLISEDDLTSTEQEFNTTYNVSAIALTLPNFLNNKQS